MIAGMSTRQCPACGSERTARAVYGQLERFGDVFYAGCLVDPEGPRQFGCHECSALFDEPAHHSAAAAR
jgi:hypothetical protein